MARLSSAPSKRYSASHRSSISRVEIEQQFSEEDSDDLAVATKKNLKRSSRPRAHKVVESEDESEGEEEEGEEEEGSDTANANNTNITHDSADVSIDHDEDEDEEEESEDELVASKTAKRVIEDEEEEQEDIDMEGDMSVDHEGDINIAMGDENVGGGDIEGEVAAMESSPVKRSPLATRSSISANNASPNTSNIVSNPSPSQKENVIVKKRDMTPDMDTNAATEDATTPNTPSRAPPSSMPVPSPMQANLTIDDGAPDGLPLPRASEEPDEVKQEEQLSHGIHARSLMQQRATSMQQHVIKTPDEPTQRLTISNLVLTNFKSYAGRQEVGPFHSVSIVEQAERSEGLPGFFCGHLV
jgi:structural maintenance of chromosome 4